MWSLKAITEELMCIDDGVPVTRAHLHFVVPSKLTQRVLDEVCDYVENTYLREVRANDLVVELHPENEVMEFAEAAVDILGYERT